MPNILSHYLLQVLLVQYSRASLIQSFSDLKKPSAPYLHLFHTMQHGDLISAVRRQRMCNASVFFLCLENVYVCKDPCLCLSHAIPHVHTTVHAVKLHRTSCSIYSTLHATDSHRVPLIPYTDKLLEVTERMALVFVFFAHAANGGTLIAQQMQAPAPHLNSKHSPQVYNSPCTTGCNQGTGKVCARCMSYDRPLSHASTEEKQARSRGKSTKFSKKLSSINYTASQAPFSRLCGQLTARQYRTTKFLHVNRDFKSRRVQITEVLPYFQAVQHGTMFFTLLRKVQRTANYDHKRSHLPYSMVIASISSFFTAFEPVIPVPLIRRAAIFFFFLHDSTLSPWSGNTLQLQESLPLLLLR